MIKMLKKMTLDELKAELNAINSSDNHTRKIEIFKIFLNLFQ
ncbi:hypothetical protein, partial [uncultured Gammaproteobacteria bacterium]